MSAKRQKLEEVKRSVAKENEKEEEELKHKHKQKQKHSPTKGGNVESFGARQHEEDAKSKPEQEANLSQSPY